MKIYLAAVEMLKQKERGSDEEEMNAVYHKIDGFLSFTPPWVLNCNVVFFQDLKIKSHRVSD